MRESCATSAAKILGSLNDETITGLRMRDQEVAQSNRLARGILSGAPALFSLGGGTFSRPFFLLFLFYFLISPKFEHFREHFREHPFSRVL